jgi:hypothetical protein
MTDEIEPLTGEELDTLADSLAVQAASYATHAGVHLIDLATAMLLAAALLLRANLSADDTRAQWRRLADQVTDLLTNLENDHARQH